MTTKPPLTDEMQIWKFRKSCECVEDDALYAVRSEEGFNTLLSKLNELRAIDAALYVDSKAYPKLHAEYYDAHRRLEALKTAATHLDQNSPDVVAFLDTWYHGLSEKYARDLRYQIMSVLQTYCVRHEIPHVIPGIRGVRYVASRKRWEARATVNGKQQRLGQFSSQGEACLAILRFKEKQRTENGGIYVDTQGNTRYIGIAPHERVSGKWRIVLPAQYEQAILRVYNRKWSDMPFDAEAKAAPYSDDQGNMFLECYGSRFAAARGYDLYARECIPAPHLNFPNPGEFDKDGNEYMADSEEARQFHMEQLRQEQARLERERSKLAYEEAARQRAKKKAWRKKLQEEAKSRRERGVLRLEGGSEVFIGNSSVVSRIDHMAWRTLPADARNVFRRRGEAVSRIFREGEDSRDYHVLRSLIAPTNCRGCYIDCVGHLYRQWLADPDFVVWFEARDDQGFQIGFTMLINSPEYGWVLVYPPSEASGNEALVHELEGTATHLVPV